MNRKNVLYVYGTLRSGRKDAETCIIPGKMYEIGWYPGVKLGGSGFFLAERVEVEEDALYYLDQYEGYDRNHPDKSLFRRVPVLDGEIYVFNNDISDKKEIVGGDWVAYGGKTGTLSGLFA